MKIEDIQISKIKANPNNPRVIKDDRFLKLVKSIQDFPEMLKARPIVVNSEFVVLGGNQRLKAAKEAGLKKIPTIIAEGFTKEQEDEFVIKDNVSSGEWDFFAVVQDWGHLDIKEWGVDIELPTFDGDPFNPEIEPTTQVSDVTKEEIEKRAKELAEEMIRSNSLLDVVCPKCAHEFQISL
jgi:hypothetical protein